MLFNPINPLTINKVILFLSQLEEKTSSKMISNTQRPQIKKLQEHWEDYLTLPFNKKLSLVDSIDREIQTLIEEAKNIYLALDNRIKQRLVKYINTSLDNKKL